MRGNFIFLLSLTKLEILIIIKSKQTLGAKVQSQEGNSPDRKLRSEIFYLVNKERNILTIRR